MKRSTYCIAALSAALFACGSGGGYRYFGDLSMRADGGPADDGGGPPPDFAGLTPDLTFIPDLTVVASCNDNQQNGKETDVDCGGGTCPKCGDFSSCLFGSDCASGTCTNNLCQPAASCNDNIKNGSETDIDCGGLTCNPCIDGRKCGNSNDCVNFNCSVGICCGANRANCDGLSGNGCEVDLSSNTNNCGTCGKICPLNMPICSLGVCKAGGMVMVGSYTLSQGPVWGNAPPTYTCQEACALLFGGQANLYSCSTSGANITHTANVDCHGDGSHCMGMNPLAENYKKGLTYTPGNCSAYVSDNCLPARNYCYK